MKPRSFIVPTLGTLSLLALAAIGPAIAGEGSTCRSEQAEDAQSETIHAVEGDVLKPIRTGGPVPAYPERAKADRIEGKVVTRIVIEKDGRVSDAEVVQSLGEDFDSLALDAVRQWSFEPASLEGEPVRVHYNITINYRLDGDGSDT